ncbi:MAG: group I intron-associated PD-(D/E)XK endonuclease, partial [Candidatus Omnitrophota bacterium]|nr:group I intron-associated PD-(D/E)XK endonuclease [Candidatus Omnitrophota bacterium]
EKNGKFIRVQVKYVTPKNGVLDVGCKSSNNWTVDKYTANQIDFIAAYNSKPRDIYFVPSSKFNSNVIKLRFKAAKNNQKTGIRQAKDFLFFK